MSEGTIFYNNLIGTCNIASADEPEALTGFGLEYLGNNNQGVVWRSDGVGTKTLDFTFTEATRVEGIVVLNHNLGAGDSMTFEASTDGTFTGVSPEYVTAVVTVQSGYKLLSLPDTYAYKYYRLTLTKTAGDYIQVGEIYLAGAVYPFERNFKWSYTYTKEINRNATQTTSGQVYRKTRFIRKSFSLDFDGVNDTQKENFETIAEDDYVCFLPNGNEGDLYYGIIDFSSFTHVYTNYWSANLTFTENPK